jgi:secreted PhoX family phosphatase
MRGKFLILAAIGGFATGANAQTVQSVEFIGMPAPSTNAQRADAYTTAQMKVTYQGGASKTYNLKYNAIVKTGEKVNNKVVGGLWNSQDAPISDFYGQIASDAPDGNSLMKISGIPSSNPRVYNPLAMVTHFEYRELPPGYPDHIQTDDPANPSAYLSYWSYLPATMGLTKLDQHKGTGALTAVDYNRIDFRSVQGGWIHCASSLSPWNTHLGAEEYEPDAKTREGLPAATGTEDTTNINLFSKYYYGNPSTANAYNYGLTPEVTVNANGSTSVVKHFALGRFARELADVQPDNKTVYMGDDGGYTGLFMFVADNPSDLSAGTLYAGKWSQISDANGGSANLGWIKLGHAADAEIKALVDGGIKFSQIFDVSNTDPGDSSYKKVRTYTGIEWLRLKPGKEKAAAFLETRRYAALLGATTEFSKMEGVTHNARDKKAYVVISRVETGMTDIPGDPQNDIRVARNDGGAIYELALAGGRNDTQGAPIPSSYVATTMTSIPDLLGGWIGATRDAEGNRCVQDKVCGGDNIKFSEGMRTIFIGEDTGRRNNNYVWAYNIDTHKLSRILSVPMYAESTGLQVVDDYYGFSYIMSNFQHAGEQASQSTSVPYQADVLALINAQWGARKKSAIGYIGTAEGGALPAIK